MELMGVRSSWRSPEPAADFFLSEQYSKQLWLLLAMARRCCRRAAGIRGGGRPAAAQ